MAAKDPLWNLWRKKPEAADPTAPLMDPGQIRQQEYYARLCEKLKAEPRGRAPKTEGREQRSIEEQFKELWNRCWWSEVKSNLGRVGINSLQDVDPAVFLASKLELQENAVEVYRVQRKIVAMFTLDRFMEERDFSIYRSVLENYIVELIREIDRVRVNCNSVLSSAEWLRKLPDNVPGLPPEQLQRWRENIDEVIQCSRKLRDNVDVLGAAFSDKELVTNAVNELRQINRRVTNHWGTWQRRVKHGFLAGFACLGALMAAVALGGRWDLFSIVPLSEWVISNLWRLALAGIAAYMLIRGLLNRRVTALRKQFASFDPDDAGGSHSQAMGVLQRLIASNAIDSLKQYFVPSALSRRNASYAWRYYVALLAPALLMMGFSWSHPWMSGTTYVVSKSPLGAPCLIGEGKTIFTFPTYKVIQDNDGAARLFRSDELYELSSQYPKGKYERCKHSGVVIDSPPRTETHFAELREMQQKQIELTTRVSALDARVTQLAGNTPQGHTSVPPVPSPAPAKVDWQLDRILTRLNTLDREQADALRIVLQSNNAALLSVAKAIQHQNETLQNQLCAFGIVSIKATMTGMSKKLRAKLEQRLQTKCKLNLDLSEPDEPAAATTKAVGTEGS